MKKLTLDITNPKLAKQWHPTKNGSLTPDDVTPGSNIPVWWIFPYDDPETGKHFDFEWEAIVESRSDGCGCPYLSGRAVWTGFNDLETKAPELAKQLHPTKNIEIVKDENGNQVTKVLTARDIFYKSGKKMVWFLPYDDPETGKHFDFEWEAIVESRSDGCGCPYLSGQAVWPGFNDLETKAPELAKQLHPTKNIEIVKDENGSQVTRVLTARDIFYKSRKKMVWFLPYDDPETGKHFDFEWEAVVSSRDRGRGCPYLSGRAVWPGFNDLETKNPELTAEWDFVKNRKLKPSGVTEFSNRKVWWICSKCGKSWFASIVARSNGLTHNCELHTND